jgi:hypothetical protein
LEEGPRPRLKASLARNSMFKFYPHVFAKVTNSGGTLVPFGECLQAAERHGGKWEP